MYGPAEWTWPLARNAAEQRAQGCPCWPDNPEERGKTGTRQSPVPSPPNALLLSFPSPHLPPTAL
eukprot:119144-Chlamydomonas_euryale.AAC.1